MQTSQTQCFLIRLLVTLGCFISLLSGCESAPSAKPIDVSQAVNELESLHNSVRDFCNGDESVGGHESLHRVNTLLKELTHLRSDCGVDETSRLDIADAATQMIDEYAEMDESLHEGEEIDYSAFQEPLQAMLDKIKTAAGA